MRKQVHYRVYSTKVDLFMGKDYGTQVSAIIVPGEEQGSWAPDAFNLKFPPGSKLEFGDIITLTLETEGRITDPN